MSKKPGTKNYTEREWELKAKIAEEKAKVAAEKAKRKEAEKSAKK
jgi:hypothetical protein